VPTFGQTIRVGILLNQREVIFQGSAPVQVVRGNKRLHTIPAGQSFRIWLGDGDDTEPGWLVQVGAFRQPESVEACTAMLAKLTDLEPVVDYVKKRDLYLVRFGPMTSLSEASAVKDLMRLNGFADVYLVSTDGTSGEKHKLHLITKEYDKHPLSDSQVTLKSSLPIQVDGERFRGELEVRINGSRFNVINELDLETYLRGVVPAELSGTLYPELEALKAQAVAARTYVYYNRNQFRSMGFDICATQSCQVYKGVSVEQELTDQAIRETAGEILTHNGKPINALFTAICGGHTEDVEHVFSGDPVPYLRGVPCEGGEGEWDQVRFMSTWTPPDTASPYYRRIYLGLARLVALDILTADGLTGLNQPVSVETATAMLKRTLVRVGLQEPVDAPPWPVNLREMGKRLANWLFDADDPDELVQAGMLVQPLMDKPATLADVSAICAALLEVFEGQAVDLLRFKVVDRSFIEAPPEPGTIFLDAGDGELPLEAARLRAGDRCRILEVDGRAAAIIILAPESQYDMLDTFVSTYRWYRFMNRAELESKISRYISVGTLKDIAVAHTTDTGRVTELRVTGSKRSGTIRGLKVRWALGGKEMKFQLFPRRDPDGNLLGAYLTGTAWGHGVGLCQVGAYGGRPGRRLPDHSEALLHGSDH